MRAIEYILGSMIMWESIGRTCANHLEHQLSVASDSCRTSAEIRMLVLQPVVLLMHANDILQENRVALGIGPVAVKVFDVPETVAAQ